MAYGGRLTDNLAQARAATWFQGSGDKDFLCDDHDRRFWVIDFGEVEARAYAWVCSPDRAGKMARLAMGYSMGIDRFRDLYLQRWDDEVWECDTLQSSKRQETPMLDSIHLCRPGRTHRLPVGPKTIAVGSDLPARLRGLEALSISWDNGALAYYLDTCKGDGQALLIAFQNILRHSTRQRPLYTLQDMIARRRVPGYRPGPNWDVIPVDPDRPGNPCAEIMLSPGQGAHGASSYARQAKFKEPEGPLAFTTVREFLERYAFPPIGPDGRPIITNCRCVLQPKETTMTKRTDLTTGSKLVRVTFDEAGSTTFAGQKRYQYLHEGSVAVGDRLVVDSPYGGLKLVTVREIDADLSMVTQSTKWTVQKVDRTAYDARVEDTKRRAETASLIRREIAQVRANAEARIREEMLSRYAPELAGLQARLAELVG